ncbi:hypothetical protein [Nitratireductor sp. StC3]|uniref:hypothetical protein n=1 Tax=Nitratireductor sp. StC3 TaxID=2126741 RepID=UPI000D0E0F69|nr:hypothetical protein [Nitratireductor sp. StC3]PSM16680.1 hypothetical protein C7T96_18555 [Nitratireductor sp. StC3]
MRKTDPISLNDLPKNAGAAGSLDLDHDKYLGELDGMDLSEDQKRELLETLWSIMFHFAWLGYSVDVCGQLFEEFNENSGPESADGTMPSSNITETPADDDEREGPA